MTSERILLTGASGNVGIETLRSLLKLSARSEFDIIAALRSPSKAAQEIADKANEVVALDFADAATFKAALNGVSRVLLVRPPQLADADTFFSPFISAMKQAGVRQVVFLSLQGVENNPLTPHHKIEKLIVESGLPFTFLRPSFFMQNLSTTHRDEIRFRNELFIPAGNGRTSFIDVRDIGAVAALALTNTTGDYLNRAVELTGLEALPYDEVARILTDILGRKITYRNPSIIRFIWQKWRNEHLPFGFTMVMVALYTVAKLGRADGLTNTTAQLLGRRPYSFRQFAEDYRAVWMP